MMNIQRFAAATGKVESIKGSILAITAKLVAVTSDGIVFDTKGHSNERLCIIFTNTHGSAAKDVKVLKPTTGGYAAADADLVLDDLAAGRYAAVWVETARFANADGTIVCTGESTDVKAVCLYW